MPSEMLSGPDLGAGYLHQLTLDRDGDGTTFTYHAQEGGADAAGPPKGALDVFGYVHPASACQFGGPRCWHRRFLLPFAEGPKVRTAYNRSRFVLEAMLGQAYAGVAPPVELALAEVVGRIAAPLEEEGIAWYVGGSTAAFVLGAPVVPRDIDLGTSRPGVDRIADLLREYLTEPAAPTDWPRSGIVRGARAFVGTFQSGARVEWAVPLDPATPGPGSEWDADPGELRTVAAQLYGHSLRVTRPEYGLVRAWLGHRPERAAPLLELARRLGPDRALAARLLERSTLPTGRREQHLRSLDV